MIIDNSVISRKCCFGLAQGDPFSPLLFNILTMEVCKSINNVCISQYADDFVLYITCSNIEEGRNQLQLALNQFVNILSLAGLEISALKSKICIFQNKFVRDPVSISVSGISLEVVDCVKYLGIWLDRKLRWSKQINELREKSSKVLNVFKVLAGSGWGIHPTHLRRLYIISCIRSRLDYASFLYGSSCKTHTSKLDKIQNQCMRVIGGFIKTTPIHVMECELHLPPLNVRRHYLAGKYWLKAKSFSNHKIIPILDDLILFSQNSYWRSKEKPLLILVHSFLKDTSIHISTQLDMFTLNTWVSNVNISNIIKFSLT